MSNKDLKHAKTIIKDIPDIKSFKEDIIRLGVCAMEKKVKSKHMKAILDGLRRFNEFEIVIFTEDIIFNKEINEWPIVDALIIFFSKGFPFSKGKRYVDLRNPFLINNFDMQSCFWDKRKVYQILEENQIPVPRHIIIDRGEEINNDGEFGTKNLNSSQENEKMVQSYIEEVERYYDEINEEPDLFLNNCPNSQSTFSLNNDVEYKKNVSDYEYFMVSDENNDNNNNDDNDNDNEEDELYDIINKISVNKIVRQINIDSNNKSDNDYDLADKKEFDNIADLTEYDDHIEYKGKKIFKPFVEKPVNGDDHNIYIYYPPSHGGGQKRLFRKTKDLCSIYIPYVNQIRRDKSYIYEDFLQTDGFDIKVYTVGPEYAHAEARKSPTLDGKVRRSSEGKEVRYPINLTPEEKEIARKIVTIFKQNVCGFDILRAKGKSYVCDVNGWSFVKENKKYVDDCTAILRKMILMKLNMNLYLLKPIQLAGGKIYQNLKLPYTTMNSTIIPNKSISNLYQNKDNKSQVHYVEELRSIVAIFRHADRTPKQKMKLIIEDQELLELYEKFGTIEFPEESNLSASNTTKTSNKKAKRKNTMKIIEITNNKRIDHSITKTNDKVPIFKEAKLKKPNELMEVLRIVSNILIRKKSFDKDKDKDKDNNIYYMKLFQLKMVLEKNTNFEGMTRKIQIKPLTIDCKILNANKKKYFVSKALMILKWGGNISHAGIDQAKLLGNTFRVQMYPSNLGDSNGLLRLHSTYRHDLKVYSSEEGRCLKTAAGFLKGLLELDGPLIPIITSLVRKDDPINKNLDISSDVIITEKEKIKSEISDCLNHNGPLLDKFNSLFNPSEVYKSLVKEKTNNSNQSNSFTKEYYENFPLIQLMESIGNPYQKMTTVLDLMDEIIESLKLFLTNEEIELECNSYFIKSSSSIQKRESEKNFKFNNKEDTIIQNFVYYNDNNKNNFPIYSPPTVFKTFNNFNPFDVLENCLLNKQRTFSTSNNKNTNPDSCKNKKINNNNNFDLSKGCFTPNNIHDNLTISKANVSPDKKNIEDNYFDCLGYNENYTLNNNNNNNNKSNDTKEKGCNSEKKSKRKKSLTNKEKLDNISESNNSILNSSCINFHDCEDEKIVLIFKRYVKLRNDFFNQATKKFDTSKIPDIYDNIKYDLIHNKILFNESASMLYDVINLLANFVMSLEYGITLDEKLAIGKKVVGPLLNKMYKDLIWWNCSNTYTQDGQKQYDESEISYSGLDQDKLENTDIKSTFRHVKTRYYFACASHMYTLLNLLIYGCDSFLLDISENNKKAIQQLRSVFDLDYCSHIVLRLYENFNVCENDPKRFRLEIIMSPGSDKDPKEADKNHLITVSPWIVLNNNLTLEQLKEFFLKF